MKKFLSLKRAAALCLAVCMIAGLLAGCGGGSSDTSDGGAAAEVDTSTLTVALTSEPDYLSIVHPDTLQNLTKLTDAALIAVAVRLGRARLIDNLRLLPL